MIVAKVLVANFSAGGTTKKLAEKLASLIDADLFEIVPEVPYSRKDLDWTKKTSRSSVEMSDRNCRPGIASKVEDMDIYDIVFVGFPVWWYREPSIIDTFMEQYDFTGKTVIPFCTSGSSGIGESGKNMQELAEGAVVLEGRRFSRLTPSGKLKQWAEQFLSEN